MAEVVDALPVGGGRDRAPLHDLFSRVSDGQVWKIAPDDYRHIMRNSTNVRCSLQAWARKRGKVAITRLDREGNVYVRVVLQGDYVDPRL